MDISSNPHIPEQNNKITKYKIINVTGGIEKLHSEQNAADLN